MTAEEFILDRAIFRSRDFANSIGVRIEVGSRKLARLEKSGLLIKVTRGVWANPKNRNYSPYGAVPYLLGTEQGYVSFLSALHRHDVVSQIPQKIFVATTGHGRTLRSKAGYFEFLQMHPTYMREGVKWQHHTNPYAMATAEKALLDCLYISTRRGNRFRYFPELNLTPIRRPVFLKLTKSHQFPQAIEKNILQSFEVLCEKYQ